MDEPLVELGDNPLDQKRNLTKYNPIPQMQGRDMGKETLDVQVTVPNPAIAAALGYNIAKPANGWPVVMLAHGITSKKEDMLAITGTLALAGYATVAIDQPLHGSAGNMVFLHLREVQYWIGCWSRRLCCAVCVSVCCVLCWILGLQTAQPEPDAHG